MRVKIRPSEISGIVKAPPSKSMAHRLLICAGLSEGVSNIRGIEYSEDICATLNCLRALGAEAEERNDSAAIRGLAPSSFKQAELNCNESGSTLRFLIPVAAMSGLEMRFTGAGRLMSRPLGVYEELFSSQGLCFEKADGLRIRGRLKAGEYRVRADISSQFISGLMFALPAADDDSIIIPEGRIESRPYIDMSMMAMEDFGVSAYWDGENIIIPGAQSYKAADASVEGDWSNAAYLMAAGAEVSGLDDNSLQGDRLCTEYFRMLDSGSAEIDICDTPDLGPALMAYAAMRGGCTLTGTGRLSIKESDRGQAMKEELAKFGIACMIDENSICVRGDIHAPAETLCGHNDHRIVMALSALCIHTGGVIDGAEAVRKSFPDYFRRIIEAGADISMEG